MKKLSKRLSLLFGSVLFIGIAIAVYVGENNKISVRAPVSQAFVFPYSSLAALENEPQIDLIIEATVTRQTQRISISSDVSPYLNYGAMRTEVQINKIIKADERVAGQQTISILEPTVVEENAGWVPGKTEFPLRHYRKAEPEKRYLFYLSWNEKQQAYWVYGDNQGKYNLDGTDRREQEIEKEHESYRLLKQEVLNKYHAL